MRIARPVSAASSCIQTSDARSAKTVPYKQTVCHKFEWRVSLLAATEKLRFA
jgi:hypothetical protein